MNVTIGAIVGLLVGLLLGALLQPGPLLSNTTDQAVALCKATGGEPLMTEFNSTTGITINCFYPGTKLQIETQPTQQDL